MSCLDESWAQVYFQVAILILLFGVGIPSLILQTIVPEDLRRIIYRNWGLYRWGFILIIGFIFIAITFVWIIHPCSSKQIGSLTTTGLIIDQWFTKLGLNLDQSIAGVFITIAIVMTGIVWVLYWFYRGDAILNILKRKCIAQIKRKGVPDERIIKDIQYLGERGGTGRDKIRVLRVLESLAENVQSHEYYDGNKLGNIVEAIEFILRKEPDYLSFNSGLKRLKDIVERLKSLNFASSADTGSVLRALRRLGEIACTLEEVNLALGVLDTIKFVCEGSDEEYKDAGLAFFQIGAIALQKKSYLVAVKGLTQLETMTWPKQPLDAQSSVAYLGLIAHFWVRNGSARKKALSSLNGIEFKPSRLQCLYIAKEIHYEAARFDTADVLTKLIAGLP